MEEITLSLMQNTEQTGPVVRRVLDEFERRSNIRVNLKVLPWESGRQEVKNYALQQRGADVSVLGTTWVKDMVAMNVLLPLKNRQTGFIVGRQEEFIPATWETTRSGQDDIPISVPWLVDTFIIHYRRDLLEKAGIDPQTAFTSLEQVDDSVRRLSEAGIPLPIQLPFTYDRFCTLHTLASWVWAKGGEFCTPEGKRVLFDQPGALKGILEYFRLARHLSSEARQRLLRSDSAGFFRQGQAALAFGTLSFMFNRHALPPSLLENWGAAPLPGPHFVGGVNLVIWKHCRREQAAQELISYLNRPEVVLQCAQAMLISPARLDALSSEEYQQDPILRVIGESARTGRGHLPVSMWGLIEDRLCDALNTIGANVLDSPDGTADAMITQTIKATAKRLNLTLEMR